MKKRYFIVLILMCLFLTGCKNEVLLEDVSVEIKGYNTEAYVVDGYEDKVDVYVYGEENVLNKIKKSKYNKVVLDLDDYVIPEEGKTFEYTFETDVKAEYDYEIMPASSKVTLTEKVSTAIDLEPRLTNLDKLDKRFGIKSIVLEKSAIIVRGSQKVLDEIGKCEAIIDISSGDFFKTGLYTYPVNTVECTSVNGEVLDEKKSKIEIVGSEFDAKIEIHEGENLYDVYSTKSVPLKVELVGEMANGTAASNITIDGVAYNQYMVEIAGNAIDNVNYVSAMVDVEGLYHKNGSKEYTVSLSLPSNVKKISRNGKNISKVKIKLDLGEAKQKTITITGIKTMNVPNGLVANLATISDSKVDVQVIGTEANLANVKAEDFEAYVDLKYYSAGTFDVGVNIENDNPLLQCISKKAYVKVVISKGN